jgi:hypothetical protein
LCYFHFQWLKTTDFQPVSFNHADDEGVTGQNVVMQHPIAEDGFRS